MSFVIFVVAVVDGGGYRIVVFVSLGLMCVFVICMTFYLFIYRCTFRVIYWIRCDWILKWLCEECRDGAKEESCGVRKKNCAASHQLVISTGFTSINGSHFWWKELTWNFYFVGITNFNVLLVSSFNWNFRLKRQTRGFFLNSIHSWNQFHALQNHINFISLNNSAVDVKLS